MFGLITWIRSKVREAVLGGVQDALAVLETAREEAGVLRLECRDEAEPKRVPAAKR